MQYLTGRRINLADGNARPNRIDRRLLGFFYRLVSLTSVLRDSPYPYSAGLVRTVTREYNTEVADHEPSPSNRLIRSPPVGQRRPRARSDDRGKRHCLRPAAARRQLHFSGDFGFFDPRTQHFERPVEQLRA